MLHAKSGPIRLALESQVIGPGELQDTLRLTWELGAESEYLLGGPDSGESGYMGAPDAYPKYFFNFSTVCG